MGDSRKKVLIALSLGALATLLIWGAIQISGRAQLIMSSTFEFQHGLIALSQLTWFAAGCVFGVPLGLWHPRTDSNFGISHLMAAAIFPLLMIAVFWLFFSPVPMSAARIRWVLNWEVQAVAAVTAGVLLTVAALRRPLR